MYLCEGAPEYDTLPGHNTTQELITMAEGYDWANTVVQSQFQEYTYNSTYVLFCLTTNSSRVSFSPKSQTNVIENKLTRQLHSLKS